jgi:hypothetical protein
MSNFEWVKKIQLDVEENEDGSCNLIFSWDEKDPDLQLWTEWGEEKQQKFVWDAIKNACENQEVSLP